MTTNALLRLGLAAFIGLSADTSAAVVTAHWTNTVSGSWTNAANWDIAEVPNNYGQVVFDVIWDSHPVTIELPAAIVTIRHFTFAIPGKLTHTGSGTSDFRIDGTLDWSQGTLAGAGNITVSGSASLHGTTPADITLEDVRLSLSGPTTLSSVLRMQRSATAVRGAQLIPYAFCVFDALGGAGFEQTQPDTSSKVFNLGVFRIPSNAASFHCGVDFLNEGSLEAGNRTLIFDRGLNQTQSGTFMQLNDTTIETATNSIGVRIETGTIAGQGRINLLTLATSWSYKPATLSGRFAVQSLTMGPDSRVQVTLGGRTTGNFDHFDVSKRLTLGGRLAVTFTNSFDQNILSTDSFEIFTLAPACSLAGSFENAPLQTRMDTADSTGSFLLYLTNFAAQTSLLLQDFVPAPIGQGVSPAVWYALGTCWNRAPEGQRFWTFFWKHWPEAWAIVQTNAALAKASADLLLKLQPAASTLLSAGNDPQIASQTLVDELNSVCNSLTNCASPDFRASLEEVRTRLDGFQALLGLNVSQAAAQLELPVPTEPWITLFGPSVTNRQFSADANLATGLNLSLLRTTNLTLQDWEVVPGAQIQTNGPAVHIIDTNWFSPMFYRLRGQP